MMKLNIGIFIIALIIGLAMMIHAIVTPGMQVIQSFIGGLLSGFGGMSLFIHWKHK